MPTQVGLPHADPFRLTANAKLATLFERKFDFLDPERFRRFDLAHKDQMEIKRVSGDYPVVVGNKWRSQL